MGRWPTATVALAALIASGCNGGGLSDREVGPVDGDVDVDADVDADVDVDVDDADLPDGSSISCEEVTCPIGHECVGGACRILDPCEVILCPAGQSCVDGTCRRIDLCEGVTCPEPDQVCDPRDGSCPQAGIDGDGDGVTLGEGDCDDSDVEVYPGAEERCDGRDNDCDLDVDEGFPDADGDGADTCGGGDAARVDCDDSDPHRAPMYAELCDGVDNDCDEQIDEWVEPRPCTTECGDGLETCEMGAWVDCTAATFCGCVGAADQAALALYDDAWSLGGICIGQCFTTQERSCVEACAADLDLSGDCVTCFADLGDCIYGSCYSDCFLPLASSDCPGCRAEQCADPFEICAGLPLE